MTPLRRARRQLAPLAGLAGAAPVLLAGWLGATACAPGPETDAPRAETPRPEAAALERAQAAADELGQRLMTALREQLGSGGPAAAINVCSEVAPAAALEIARDGVEIRRTSLRYRNPDNAPDDWERGWLERFEAQLAQGEPLTEVHEVDEAGGELRYLRPIMVGSGCLLCHGPADGLDPDVRARLAERYPEDRATGFAAGDLRGAFSVRVVLADPDAG